MQRSPETDRPDSPPVVDVFESPDGVLNVVLRREPVPDDVDALLDRPRRAPKRVH